jgi:hypothetical protein
MIENAHKAKVVIFTLEPSKSTAMKKRKIQVRAKDQRVEMFKPGNMNSPRSYPNHIHMCIIMVLLSR